MVFASVVKNDEILKKGIDVMNAHLDLGQEKTSDFTLPKITSLDDVYDIGVLCEARAIHDETNPMMPYILNLFPQEKAQLVNMANHDD